MELISGKVEDDGHHLDGIDIKRAFVHCENGDYIAVAFNVYTEPFNGNWRTLRMQFGYFAALRDCYNENETDCDSPYALLVGDLDVVGYFTERAGHYGALIVFDKQEVKQANEGVLLELKRKLGD